MILPGTLSFTLIRGIQFDSVILQCRDENVAVTGTLSPDVTGSYVPCGNFSGYPLFILEGAPATFLYFNAAAASYVLARLLTTAALTDYWSPAAPLTEPSGTYVNHGANTGTATADDNPTDLSAYTVEAKVRRSDRVGAEVILDLNPSVTNATTGEITIPAISANDTNDIGFTGSFRWDMVLVQAFGAERFGPFLSGPFIISDNISQKAIPPP